MSASSNSKNLQEVTIPARHNTVLYGVASFGSTIDVHIVNALLGAPSWQLRGPMPDGLHPGKAQNTLLVCQERIGNPDDWPPTTHTVVIEPALKDRKLSLSFGHENVGTAPPGPAKYVQMDLSGSGKSYIYYTQGEDGGARYNIELCVSILPPLN